MFKPTFSFLDSLESSGVTCLSGCSRMHPNPRLYKYLWHVFWRGSQCEGIPFWNTPPLSTKAAIDLIAHLEAHAESCIVSNHRLPREGVPIWSATGRRQTGGDLAPAYDVDPDPATDTGHK